jgi:hypothetical protein
MWQQQRPGTYFKVDELPNLIQVAPIAIYKQLMMIEKVEERHHRFGAIGTFESKSRYG